MKAFLAALALVLALTGGALATTSIKQPAAAATVAAAAPASPTPCQPAASLFGQTICTADLDQAQQTDIARGLRAEQGKFLAHDSAAQALVRRQEAMKTTIWRRALVQRFGTAAVTPSAQEIADYRQHFDQSMNSSYVADKRMADYIQDMLNRFIYPAAREQQLQRVVKTANLSAQMYEERQNHTHTVPKEYQFVVDNAENKVAADMLTVWKQDKALYAAYGGALTTTETGLQPVGAYQKFMAYIEANGHYAPADPAYKDSLNDLKSYIASIKMTVSPPESVAQHYYATQDWQFSLSNSPEHFEEVKTRLNAIPNLGLKTPDAAGADALIGRRSMPPAAATPVLAPVPASTPTPSPATATTPPPATP